MYIEIQNIDVKSQVLTSSSDLISLRSLVQGALPWCFRS